MEQCPNDQFELEHVIIRLAGGDDYPSVRELYYAGFAEKQVPDNDTGADMEAISQAYLADEGRSGFWVALYEDLIIGMVGVQRTSDNSTEIRRLRVKQGFRRRGVATKLMEHAIAFCQRHGYLKVILDVRIERGPAIAMFEKFGFQLARTREVAGRRMLDFYIDLYRDPNV